jgi:hypothetical protein
MARRKVTPRQFLDASRWRINPDEARQRLQERDARVAADNRTEVEKYFGDPPRDRSALANIAKAENARLICRPRFGCNSMTHDDRHRQGRAGVYRARAHQLAETAARERDDARRRYFMGLASSYRAAAELLAPEPPPSPTSQVFERSADVRFRG